MYHKDMPIEGTRTTKADGDDKDVYTVAFTNGALQELEELQQKLNLSDLEAVLKLSIALLSKVQESGANGSQKSAE